MIVETGDNNITCENAITNCGIVVKGKITAGSNNSPTEGAYAVYDVTTGSGRTTGNVIKTVGETTTDDNVTTSGVAPTY